MSLRTTLTLLIVLGLLVGVLLLKKDTAPTESGGPPETLLAGLDASFDVTRFDLQHSRSRERSTFELRDGGWWLVEPSDRAKPEEVQYLIDTMRGNLLEVVEKNPDKDRLAAAGLEPPLGRVTLHGRNGETLGVRVGEFDPTRAYCYVMLEGTDEPTLYRTGANLRNTTDKPRQEWRDHRFLVGDAAFLRRVELIRPKMPKIVLEKIGTSWAMLEPRAFNAASSVVSNLLVGGLLRMTVNTFAEANPTEDDMVRYLLDDEHATIVRFDFGGDQPLEARFGVIEGDSGAPRIAWDSNRQVLLFVQGSEVLELLTKDEKAFRDPVITTASIGTCRWVKMTKKNGELAFELRYDPTLGAFRMENPIVAEIDDTRNGALRPWFLDVRALEAQKSEPGIEREGFVDAKDFGAETIDRIFEELEGLIEMELVDRTGVTTRERIEFAAPTGETYYVRSSKHPDVIYVVEARLVDEVLNRDRRTFLARKQLPDDLNRMNQLTVTLADARSMHIRRKSGGPKARNWIDPKNPTSYTGLLEGWFSKAITLEAVGFLGRDPIEEDGFDPPQATIEIQMTDNEYFYGSYTLEIGAKAPNGGEVLARSPSHLGERVVFRLDSAILDELLGVFEKAEEEGEG